MSAVPSANQKPDMFSLARPPKNIWSALGFAIIAVALANISSYVGSYIEPTISSPFFDASDTGRFEAMILRPGFKNVSTDLVYILLALILLLVQQKRKPDTWVIVDRKFGINLFSGTLLGLAILAPCIASLFVFRLPLSSVPPFDTHAPIWTWSAVLTLIDDFLGTVGIAILFLGWLLPSLKLRLGDETAIWCTALSFSLPSLFVASPLGLGIHLAVFVESVLLTAILTTLAIITGSSTTSIGLKLIWVLASYVALMRENVLGGTTFDTVALVHRFFLIWYLTSILVSMLILWILRRKHLLGFTWAPEVQPREAAE